MRTLDGWPSEADKNTNANGCLVFRTGRKTTTAFYDRFEEASGAFVALYAEYPGIVWEGSQHEPDYTHRCSVPNTPSASGGGRWYNSEYGNRVFLFYKDDRRKGWQYPSRDKNGRFYRGAFLSDTRSLAGYGYMRKREPKEMVPISTISGYYLGTSLTAAVNVGGLVVEQADINRIRRETGGLPKFITHYDYSGSFQYLSHIVWGEEPEILAEEKSND
jgi:hypothetical protein